MHRNMQYNTRHNGFHFPKFRAHKSWGFGSAPFCSFVLSTRAAPLVYQQFGLVASLLAAFRGLWLRGDPEVERAQLHTASGGGPRCRRASQTPFSPPPNRVKTRGPTARGEPLKIATTPCVPSFHPLTHPPHHASRSSRSTKTAVPPHTKASHMTPCTSGRNHQQRERPAETSYRQRIARSAKPANKTSVRRLQHKKNSSSFHHHVCRANGIPPNPRANQSHAERRTREHSNHALSRASLRRTDWCIALVACHVTSGRSATTWSHVTLSELWIGSWRPHGGNSLAK